MFPIKLHLDSLKKKLFNSGNRTIFIPGLRPVVIGDYTLDSIYRVVPRNWFHVQCFRSGKLIWEDCFQNLVVNQGLSHILDVILDGGTQITTWYAGLTDGSPSFAAGDTLASHGGWTEFTEYDEANRPTISWDGEASQSIDNSATPSQFTINSSQTAGGAFVSSDNQIGGGSTVDTLYGGAAFTGGNRSVQSGDTVNVTITCTASSS